MNLHNHGVDNNKAKIITLTVNLSTNWAMDDWDEITM